MKEKSYALPKFDIGQEVWSLQAGKAVRFIVVQIHLTTGLCTDYKSDMPDGMKKYHTVEYQLSQATAWEKKPNGANRWNFKEEDVYASKELLILGITEYESQ